MALVAAATAQSTEYDEVEATLDDGTRVRLYNLRAVRAAIAKSVEGRWYANASTTRLQTLHVHSEEGDADAAMLEVTRGGGGGGGRSLTLARLSYMEIDLSVSRRDPVLGVYYIDVDFTVLSYRRAHGSDPDAYSEQVRYMLSRWLIVAAKNSAVFIFKDAKLVCRSRYAQKGIVRVDTCPRITETGAAQATELDTLQVEWSE